MDSPKILIARFTDRPARGDDAAFIVRVHSTPHARGALKIPPLDKVVRRLGEPGYEQRIVLDEGGEPAAFWMAHLEESWLAHFQVVAALEPRRGAGRFAIERCIAWAFEEAGVNWLYLEVTAANVNARALYESCGFVHEGTWREGFRDDDGRFDDLLVFALLRRDRLG